MEVFIHIHAMDLTVMPTIAMSKSEGSEESTPLEAAKDICDDGTTQVDKNDDDGAASEYTDANTENESYGESDSSQSTATVHSSQSTKIKRKNDLKQGYKKKRRKKSKVNSFASKSKLGYKCTNFIKEDHKQPIFGVQFYRSLLENECDPLIFATVGSNRVSIYRCENGSGRIHLLQSFVDSDPEENFYTCAWSCNIETGDPLLAFAGNKGVVHVLNAATRLCTKTYQGHGSAVNELCFHPIQPELLLSASKDHTIRLWNIKTDVCIAIFGGVEGHRDEVLSMDLDIVGEKLVSCGMDHSLKIWSLNSDKIKEYIKHSYDYDLSVTGKVFQSLRVHFPQFSTRDIHRNYVDCVKWFGDLILSKSCDNCVVCWKPVKPLGKLMQEKISSEVGVSVLHKFEYTQCEIWFMKFTCLYQQKMMAVGNQFGKMFLWDLDVDQPSEARTSFLSHPRCVTAIRQLSFNKDAAILIAVCDDGTVWRWDKVNQ